MWADTSYPRRASTKRRTGDSELRNAAFQGSARTDDELMTAIIDALEANQTMSRQALDSAMVRAGQKSILLGPAQL